ncbi:MAG: universal stress protein [Bacteroidia bacterium]|nr:universal stress protein [Bacteroidia bacterium]NNF31469.1 universal stress protein [Flavobacteriaceae bacterium]MBT8275544.1 universal stress protein [Bacteroidia bacterium]NNJ82056.1 universal stress protein [Flavobacteriaceae bacterium]NNK54048.1 universal stress protein [Flavobacteriaceae bacterium]
MKYHEFNTIGIGVAFSPNLKANIYEASRLAIFFESRLVLIHVGDRSNEKTEIIKSHLMPFIDRELDYEILFVPGDPVSVILDSVERENIDLLLLGALQREKFLQFYIGTIARKITRKASCAVLLHINPSVQRVPCKHIVVNGMKSDKSAETIASAFYVAYKLGTDRLTIVEEISQDEVAVKVEDDKSLRKSALIRDKLRRRESNRVKKIIQEVPQLFKKGVAVTSQPIFGRRGYSIGHYAELVRADLLILSAPGKSGLRDRIFPHDNEYILKELPTDVLILP